MFALLFILDPFTPASRIISIIGVLVVGILSKMEKRWRDGNTSTSGIEILEETQTVTEDSDDTGTSHKDKKL